MAPEEKIDHRLEELHRSGYKIVDGQPDITGWNIKARSGKKIGKVDDLLFDPHSHKVRYLVVDLDNNELGLNEDRRVLVPIGIAELYTKADSKEPRERDLDPAYSAYDPAEGGNVVYIPSVSAQQLDELPLYEKGRLSRHVEMAIRRILEPQRHSAYDEDEFYRHEHFDDDRFYEPHRHHHSKNR
ncbi:PRC-barrel domain-containing protein [Mucilaginibacter sp. McL0603]|uniref:PRC-barrel domain-containing protein n=1 Tax=Mucilaginibacter sp. McL0603 TaxID=3415670 RepID=UPI003CEF7182